MLKRFRVNNFRSLLNVEFRPVGVEVVPISVGGAVATPSGILRTLDLLGNTLFLIVIL